jgi:hypothetical protein
MGDSRHAMKDDRRKLSNGPDCPHSRDTIMGRGRK